MFPLIIVYFPAFWFQLQTKSLEYNLSKINKGKQIERKLKKYIDWNPQSQPWKLLALSTELIGQWWSDNKKKYNLKPKPFVMSGNLKLVLRIFTSLYGDALTFLLDNIFIRFGTKLYRQVVGIPMGTNCAPLVADLFLFCYERDFMMSLSDDKQADVIDAFNTTSRYLDDILNINNVYFDNMVSQIYPSELQLNKANASDTEAAFLDLHLSISNDIVSTKIYDKRDDFDFEIVNFPFLDGDVPRSTSYGVYISQLIRFARASSYVADFNTRNKLLTQKLLKQGYRYHKLRKTFSKFYRRYYDLISKFQVGLKSLLRQGLSEPDFYGDLVYKLKKIVGSNNFSTQFIKIISHYKKIGYNINVLQQTACLVVNPITVGNFAFLFNCTPVGRTSDSMMVPT